ncbi:MAG: hypothetical protein U1E36_03920 [Rickettsiales bacterium]
MPTISRQQIDDLRPVLEKVADDILDKRFGMKGALYIMGGGVLIPGNPAQSMTNYDHVRTVGVEGVAIELFQRKQATALPKPMKASRGRIFPPGSRNRRQQKDYVAESARRDELVRQRQSIYSRGPGYTGSPDESRPGAALVV